MSLGEPKDLLCDLLISFVVVDRVCIYFDRYRTEHLRNWRLQQIPLMTNIYQNASEVIGWLGESKNTSLAIELARRAALVNRLDVSLRANGHI
jgi:hypothetical protein